ncbi:hypothetical protein F4810DRAFT_651396 [Camillea tinctor]|nr:hypothetical protein F4810DRAFT_651396 [Camillea tinctor]
MECVIVANNSPSCTKRGRAGEFLQTLSLVSLSHIRPILYPINVLSKGLSASLRLLHFLTVYISLFSKSLRNNARQLSFSTIFCLLYHSFLTGKMIRGSGSWSLFGWTISFSILTTIIVLLRFWSAKIQKRKFFMDDGFVIASYVAMLAQQGIAIWAMVNGMGNPATDLTIEELLIQAKVLVAVSTTWIFSTTAVKLAVLALYMRIFTTAAFKRWAISLMVIDVCFGITFLVVFITHCNPVSQEWDPVPWGWCRPLNLSELSSISLNLALDTAIVVLPMPLLWNLQMALSKKLLVMVMFSFGFATIAIMCYRIDQTVNRDPDPMLAIAKIGLLSDLELWLGIIVACLPTLAPFFRTYVQPGLLNLSRKLYGRLGLSTKEGTPRVQLKTVGGSGGSSCKCHNNYTEVSETSTCIAPYCDEIRLVANETPKLHTDCEFNNMNTAPSNGI